MFKSLLFSAVLSVFLISSLNAQNFVNENFEGTDSLLPAGWYKYNNAGFPISVDPDVNWTVRDSGSYAPGLSTALTKAHSGTGSVGVSWWSSIDSNGTTPTISDAWLVTPPINVTNSNFILRFWASGGSGPTNFYVDSLSVWVNFLDSTVQNFSDRIGGAVWSTSAVYGQFTQYTISLAAYQLGVPVRIGFRYNMDCAVDGFFVYLDDVFIGDPTSISQIGNNLPQDFDLKQNYPNPFNPTTSIRFDLPTSSNVNLYVFNSLGQKVMTLLEGNKSAGTYEAKFDATGLASGTYFYRLEAGNYVATKKMLLVK